MGNLELAQPFLTYDLKVMEQYVHTLIPSDSSFVPKSSEVAEFFEALVTSFNFQVISDAPFQPGLRVRKPSGRFRTGINVFTGEKKTIPISDQVKIENPADIPQLIEGITRYAVLASGEWKLGSAPLALFTTDGIPFEKDYLCEVSCNLRPETVSTSCSVGELASNHQNVRPFGEPCDSDGTTGIFTHPWTGKTIEVPNAGCARFWIEFEFGKFLLPQIASSFDILNPMLVAKTEECFQTKFTQGWRFN